MTFRCDVFPIFIGDVFASVLVVLFHVCQETLPGAVCWTFVPEG
jgi:hypothetical protein